MSELEEQLVALGYTVDHGDLIDGPFIPDGTVRVLRGDDAWEIAGEGPTLRDAASLLIDTSVKEDDLVFVETRQLSPQWEIQVDGKVLAIVTERLVSEPPYNVRLMDHSDHTFEERAQVIEFLLGQANLFP